MYIFERGLINCSLSSVFSCKQNTKLPKKTVKTSRTLFFFTLLQNIVERMLPGGYGYSRNQYALHARPFDEFNISASPEPLGINSRIMNNLERAIGMDLNGDGYIGGFGYPHLSSSIPPAIAMPPQTSYPTNFNYPVNHHVFQP